MDNPAMKNVESHIVLGYACNHYCRHCVVQAKRARAVEEKINDFSKEESFSAVKTAIKNGATKIVFTGGEPTLREDLPELISFCLAHGCSAQIQTNGSFPDKIRQICNKNISLLNRIEFMIPLHSANAKTHDYICRSKGAFDNVMESLGYLSDIAGVVIGKIVLTKNTDDLNAVCNLYEKYGAKSIIIAYPHCVSFPVEAIREVDLEEAEVKNIIKGLYRIEYKVPIILQAFPRCFVGDIPQAIIQEEQPEFLSLEIIEHQFRAESSLLWHTYRKLDKRKFSRCCSCEHNETCEGIWKDYLKAYGDQ